MSFLDDLKAHAEAVKAWLVEFEQHLMHGTPAAPPPPPMPPIAPVAPPVAPPVVADPPPTADNSADALNKAEVEENKAG